MHETCRQLALWRPDGIAGARGCRLRQDSEACKTPCFVSFGPPNPPETHVKSRCTLESAEHGT
ncbi:hypothetical protein Q5P01_012900 [Channa striata]|uniref:Uncharacterized protein n=1 Tax=Channa striata TaxID=64152 RepID=A0AA88MQL8_CHASR|nr:hypothetical protein Q5P01_012900 [Channa striata]